MLSKNNNKESKTKIAACYRFFLLLAVIFVFNGFLMTPVQAQLVEDFSPETVSGLDNSAGLENIEENINLNDTDIRLFIARIINVVLGFLGIILVILIVYAGWLYMTSTGDSAKIELAKNIIKNSVIGLIIILSAFGISQFIFRALLNKGGGGSGVTSPPTPYEIGVGALGSGAIESHYPTRNQLEVPRNTNIIITFKEKIDINSVCTVSDDDCFLNTDAIKIYPLANENNLDDVDSYLASNQVRVASVDNKTFIFDPIAYLGNSSTKVWYGAKLEESLKKEGSNEIVDLDISGFYAWKFEVSNKLDLTPPQVSSVFPPADNKQDAENTASSAAQAQWSVSISGSLNSYKKASITKDVPDNISVSGTYHNCSKSGNVNFVISVSENNLSVVLDGQTNVQGFNNSSLIINNQAQIGCGLIVDFTDDPQSFTGQKINLKVQDEVMGDEINIQGNSYMFGRDIILNNSVQDMVDALENDPWITADTSGQGLILTARSSKLRGASSNQLKITTTSEDTLVIKQVTTGRDKGATLKTVDLPDQPRNAIIQVNFNEAINPMYVDNYIAVKNGKNNITGEFKISNNYKTIEFVPAERCGQNSCGEDTFCLPAETNIKVILKAADLYQCVEDIDCLSEAGGFGEYNKCGANSVCQKEDINYPQANSKGVFGIMDLSSNSLDGNSNNNSESAPTDNYVWSFWTTSQSDLEGPTITQAIQKKPANDFNLVKQGAQATGASRELPVNIKFNKLMMSSTIKPGQGGSDDVYPNSNHRREYLAQINYSDWPLGYWCSKEDIDNDNDGYADYTAAITSHTMLKEGQGYGFLVGSGLRDIYQNCYNPANDNHNCSNLSAGQSCCLGRVIDAGEVCYEF